MSEQHTDQEQDSQEQDSQQQASDEGQLGYAEKQREKFKDEDRELTDVPEIKDEHRDKAKEMRKSYEEDRPTTVMPGTDKTVTGTAVNDWIDDDGNPKYGDDSNKEDQEPSSQTPKQDQTTG